MTDRGEFRPEVAFLSLGDDFHDPVAPAAFPRHELRYRNQRAAAEVGLDGLADAGWIAHFGRFEPLPGSLPQPLALRYHGHQFRTYNPELGDGRGFLFAQLRDRAGRLMDLGTKGSGRTPWSRFGDGKLTLKGAVREILATEMQEALGVTTSRTLSVIETGEALERGDEPSPARSAVLVRLSHSHVRYGSFQRLAALQMPEAMQRLTDYVLREIAAADPGPDPFREAADGDFRKALAAAIDGLPEREKMVMSLYYDDELNLREIGLVLGVTESRVCQLHGQALVRLKARLTDWRDKRGE